MNLSAVRLAIYLISAWLLLSAVTLYPGVLRITGHEVDLLHALDIAYRIRLRGGFGVQCRRSIVHHVGSASSGRASPFVIYHGTRNRIWTFLKNTPPLLLIAMLPAHVLVNLAFLVRSVAHRRFRATWKATLDGFSGWGWIMRERRELARTRSVGSLGIARALTWSPLKLLRRAPDVRPLDAGQTE